MNEIVVGTDTLLKMAHNMLDRGEITLSQYGAMCRRSKEIKNKERKNLIILS